MYLLYFLLWVIFNGNITLEICIFGIVIAAVMLAFTCRFMDYSIQSELWIVKHYYQFAQYAFVLVKEIIQANFAVIRMILTEREEIEPVLVSFHTDMKTPVIRAFLANAITLTPGTITVTLEDSDYVVHCLDESLAEGMDDSVITQLLAGFERD